MMTMNTKVSAPAPSVVHLVTLFRQIAGGEIRIPAFQREYVWNEKQVLSLLNSVYESYPIGSLLFWRVEKKVFDVAPRSVSSFPDLPEKFPMNYVLDGMQRLTTLFGVFNYEDGINNPTLNVGFDLRAERFHQISDGRPVGNHVVPLASLFSPKKLLDFQSRLASEADNEKLIDAVLNVQAAFQEYMVPTVTIQSDDVKRVVGIFERVNSTGTRLNSVDFMRAITWSTSFDLTKKIEGVAEAISEFGWQLKSETIVKCAAIVLGNSISSEALVNLRDEDEKRLHLAFDGLPTTIKAAADLLYEEFGILSPNVVSYEGQILTAFLLCHLGVVDEVKKDFVKWFWSCGLNEQLRGKPDDYIVRLLDEWRLRPEAKTLTAPSTPSFTDRDFMSRRLQAGSALTNTFKMLFKKSKAIDLIQRKLLPPAEFLADSSTAQFVPVFGKDLIADTLEGDFVSAKFFANSVLVASGTDIRNLDIIPSIERLLHSGAMDVLASQLIPPDAAEAAVAGHVREFLRLRAHAIAQFGMDIIR